MYKWYKNASACYAYLCDVPPKEVEDPWRKESKFRESRWFERGWTLQELIAPDGQETLSFFSESWSKLGSKMELVDLLFDITGINRRVLKHGDLRNVSSARKMSWASKRITTRVEDRAYSLLGLFNVNMPLLYGEGGKAFIRLQEAILKQTDDESLFVHHVSQYDLDINLSPSLLATSPESFSESADIFLYERDPLLHDDPESVSVPSLLTNKGVQVNFLGCPCSRIDYDGMEAVQTDGWLVILNCWVGDDVLSRPAIFLKSLDLGADRFTRFDQGPVFIVRCKNGEVTIDRLGQEPLIPKDNAADEGQVCRKSFSVAKSKESMCPYPVSVWLTVRQVLPEIKTLQRRTVFVDFDDIRTRQFDRPCVWVKRIIQPKDRHFVLIGGFPKWEMDSRKLSGKLGRHYTVLMLQDVERNEAFAIAIHLETAYRMEDDRSTYRAWCTIIELATNVPFSHLLCREIIESLREKRDYKDPLYLVDKKYVAISTMQDKVLVRATLGLEEFLGRKEYILKIELLKMKDESCWRSMRDMKTKLFKLGDKCNGNLGELGYMTEEGEAQVLGREFDEVEVPSTLKQTA